jgi:hypothetical protein
MNDSLPCPSLPYRALTLIREYSKPLTRPDWRKSKPIVSTYRLYLNVINNFSNLHYHILSNIWLTEWYELYTYIKTYGFDNYYYNHKNHNILQIDGIAELKKRKLF